MNKLLLTALLASLFLSLPLFSVEDSKRTNSTFKKQRFVLKTAQQKDEPVFSLHENNYFLLFQEPVKFQYSFKFRFFRTDSSPANGVYFAYTQVSLWDFWAWSDSLPFLETNFSPELFYRYYYKNRKGTVQYFQTGIWHQSNGKGGDEIDQNRSWNHLYAELGLLLLPRLRLTTRIWLPFGMGTNPNKDITEYIGFGKFTLEAGPFPEFLSSKFQLAFRKGWSTDLAKMSIELNVIFGPIQLFGSEYLPLGFHIQLWHGYCETLLKFNQSDTKIRAGFAIILN